MPRLSHQAKPSFFRQFKRRVFYPDLMRLGGLPQALDNALGEIGSPFRVVPQDDWFVVYARVEMEHRFSQVYIAAHGRAFLFDCWDRGACLAHGSTWSLRRLALAIDRWVGSTCAIAVLACEFPFVTAKADAAIFERGEELEYTWRQLVKEAEQRLTRQHWAWERWDEFVVAASRRPQLRQLFPIPSYMFRFSRCTRYPFTCDVPMVSGGGDDGYYVVAPRDRQLLGRGDAEYAADLVVRHVPQDCGTALVGTADDLARQIAARDGIAVDDVRRRIM